MRDQVTTLVDDHQRRQLVTAALDVVKVAAQELDGLAALRAFLTVALN